MIKNTLTAVISNTMEYFHHWARERRIRPMKGSNRWIDNLVEMVSCPMTKGFIFHFKYTELSPMETLIKRLEE